VVPLVGRLFYFSGFRQLFGAVDHRTQNPEQTETTTKPQQTYQAKRTERTTSKNHNTGILCYFFFFFALRLKLYPQNGFASQNKDLEDQ